LDVVPREEEGKEGEAEAEEAGEEGKEEGGREDMEEGRGTYEHVPKGGAGGPTQVLAPTDKEEQLEEQQEEGEGGGKEGGEEEEEEGPLGDEDGVGMDMEDAEKEGATRGGEEAAQPHASQEAPKASSSSSTSGSHKAKTGGNREGKRREEGEHLPVPEMKGREEDGKEDEVRDGDACANQEGEREEGEEEGGEEGGGRIVTNPAPPPAVGEGAGPSIDPSCNVQDGKKKGKEEKEEEEEEEEEEVLDLRRGVQGLWQEHPHPSPDAAANLWARYRSASAPLALRLCEQLRLVLEPQVASKLGGDYRSGKRINMRRVIPYIASGYRKDKIWLRRTKPAKRAYQVLLAIDDSGSMKHFGAEDMALTALATLASGMSALEIGEVGVAAFGETLSLLHGFGEPWTEDAGARVLSSFTFEQEATDGALLLESVSAALEMAARGARQASDASQGQGVPAKIFQLVFVVSDGSFERGDKATLRRLVRQMGEKGQLLVLLIVDRSIEERQEVEYSATGGVRLSKYLDSYPFPYYVVLRDVQALPEVMADALKQWFELLGRE
jgi:midasin